MKISKTETQKRLQFLRDFFSRDPDSSCQAAQRALKGAFGQEMRPLVVSAIKRGVIEAQNAAIISQALAITDTVREFNPKADPGLLVNIFTPGLTPGDNSVIVAPTGCGGDCSSCNCGGK